VRTIDEPTPVTKVLPIWNIQMSEGEPVPARVKTPPAARFAELEYLYNPGPRVWLARFPLITVALVIARIWLYTLFPAVKADEAALLIYSVPVNVPGGKPVIAVCELVKVI
jgi:hypothetical protein